MANAKPNQMDAKSPSAKGTSGDTQGSDLPSQSTVEALQARIAELEEQNATQEQSLTQLRKSATLITGVPRFVKEVGKFTVTQY